MYFPVAVGGPVTKIIDEYAAGFEKENPGIKIKPIYAGDYQQTVAKVLTAIKGGDVPETAILLAADLFLLEDEGVIVPIEDFARTPDDKAWLATFYPAFMENAKLKGKTYAIPFQRSTPVLYWNKEHFKAAGLDPDKGPRNWAEMREMARKLTKKDASGAVTQWGIQIPSDGNTAWLFTGMTTGNGVRLTNADGNKVSFDDPKVVEAVQAWHDLSRVDGTQPRGLISWGATPRDFIDITKRGTFHDHPRFVGSPKDVADGMEEWFATRACDGFVVAAGYVPGGYEEFSAMVVPELQRRGLFHTDYAGTTLRENLGLERPAADSWKKWHHG